MYTSDPWRHPGLEVHDWRSPDQPPSAVIATRPMHLTGLLAEVADLLPRPKTSVLRALRRFTAVIREWRRRARSRRELLALDDHMLEDIGITRVDALYEVAKPFWR
jgi:uncharacterized protein YjiS (DUF1127 family)